MKAVILIGGFGTRLEPLTVTRPKAMVPVLNKPFLEYLLSKLERSGVDQAVLSCGYLPDSIGAYFGNGEQLGIRIEYVTERFPLGTGGGIKNASEFLDGTFLVVNGDIFTDIDIDEMYNFHRARQAAATIALTPVEDPSRYGVIETDFKGRVRQFLEKPSAEKITTNMINAGLIIMEPELLSSIPEGTEYSYEKQLFPGLLAAGKPVYGFKSDAYWIDIGTPQKYFQLNSDLLHGLSSQYVPEDSSGICIHPGAAIGTGVCLVGTVILGEGVKISANSAIQDCLLWEKVEIGSSCILKGAIIAEECVIGHGCSIDGAVIGRRVHAGPGLSLHPGTRIYPSSSVF